MSHTSARVASPSSASSHGPGSGGVAKRQRDDLSRPSRSASSSVPGDQAPTSRSATATVPGLEAGVHSIGAPSRRAGPSRSPGAVEPQTHAAPARESAGTGASAPGVQRPEKRAEAEPDGPARASSRSRSPPPARPAPPTSTSSIAGRASARSDCPRVSVPGSIIAGEQLVGTDPGDAGLHGAPDLRRTADACRGKAGRWPAGGSPCSSPTLLTAPAGSCTQDPATCQPPAVLLLSVLRMVGHTPAPTCCRGLSNSTKRLAARLSSSHERRPGEIRSGDASRSGGSARRVPTGCGERETGCIEARENERWVVGRARNGR